LSLGASVLTNCSRRRRGTRAAARCLPPHVLQEVRVGVGGDRDRRVTGGASTRPRAARRPGASATPVRAGGRGAAPAGGEYQDGMTISGGCAQERCSQPRHSFRAPHGPARPLVLLRVRARGRGQARPPSGRTSAGPPAELAPHRAAEATPGRSGSGHR